jgi:hypothetical protein
MRENTKTAKAIEFLKLIKEEHTPSSLDIIRISEKVGCSERLVWRALRLLREKEKNISEDFSLLKELFSDLLFFVNLFRDKVIDIKKLTAKEQRILNSIGKKIEYLQDKLDIKEYKNQQELLHQEIN